MDTESSIQIQNDSMKMINGVLEKMKSLQDKYENSINVIQKKNEEALLSQEKINDLNKKLTLSEKQIREAQTLLKNEKEKYLNLEKKFIASENKLFLTERKYQNMTALEKERDELTKENVRLLNNCVELETALEVYQSRMKLDEEKIIKMNKSLKESATQMKAGPQEKNIESVCSDIVSIFQINFIELNSKWQDIKNELLTMKEIYNEYTEKIISILSSSTEMVNASKTFPNYFYQPTSMNSNFCFFNNEKFNENMSESLTLLTSYQNTLQELLKETLKQRDMLQRCESNILKHEDSAEKINKVFSSVKESPPRKNQQFKNITRRACPRRSRSLPGRKNLQKYAKTMQAVIKNFKKQIMRQETLKNKWKKITHQVISNFENRLNHLHKSNVGLEKENLELMYLLHQYESADKKILHSSDH